MAESEWFKRLKRKDPGKRGRKAEKNLAQRTRARLHAGSGSIGEKADMSLGDLFKVESKSTEAASFSLQLGDLLKVTGEAREVGRVPMLVVQFVDADGKPVKNGSWCMLPEHVIEELIDE